GVAHPRNSQFAAGSGPRRSSQLRTLGRSLGPFHQRTSDSASSMLGVDGAEDLGAVEVLEPVERQRRIADELAVLASEPQRLIGSLATAVATLEEERLGRVVTQRYAVQSGVVDRCELAGQDEVEVGDLQPLDPGHTATSCR